MSVHAYYFQPTPSHLIPLSHKNYTLLLFITWHPQTNIIILFELFGNRILSIEPLIHMIVLDWCIIIISLHDKTFNWCINYSWQRNHEELSPTSIPPGPSPRPKTCGRGGSGITAATATCVWSRAGTHIGTSMSTMGTGQCTDASFTPWPHTTMPSSRSMSSETHRAVSWLSWPHGSPELTDSPLTSISHPDARAIGRWPSTTTLGRETSPSGTPTPPGWRRPMLCRQPKNTPWAPCLKWPVA